MGRQRPADRAPRAELLRRPLRSVAAVRSGVRRRRTTPPKPPVSVSRPNFIELCNRLTAEDEKAFEAALEVPRAVGRLVDDLRDDRHARAARVAAGVPAPAERGLAYQVEAPTLWDVDFKTAVAQAELEDRERRRRLPPHPVRARRSVGGSGSGPSVEIETTRPELIPACVALVAHPDDERYQPLFGQEVVTPLFGARVPVQAACRWPIRRRAAASP